jgi:hypothetical protein
MKNKLRKNNSVKNKAIEEALRKKYTEGFKKLKNDPEMIKIAEEGMHDYFSLLRKP